MQLDLTRFRQSETEFAQTFQPSDVEQPGDVYRIVAPVALEIRVHKDKNRFRLVGRARTELELPCSRCVEPFRMPVDAPFDQRYLPAAEIATDPEREVQDEDLDLSYYRDDRIDLNELLREQFYLALPMKPLCRDACRGLCPQCGTNLNTDACTCGVAREDPRLAPLRGLVKPRES